MDEAIGQRFAIVGTSAALARLRPDAVQLPEVASDWLQRHGLRGALLRPDRYIYAVS